MPYRKTLALLTLVSALSACNDDSRVQELVCRAEYRYSTQGADAAIATIREIGDPKRYAVGINVTRYLILRGASTGNIQDFDEARAVLNATKMLDYPGEIVPLYASVLRFLAIANGSNPASAREELTQYCRESPLPESECLHDNMRFVFDRIGTSSGTANKSFQDKAKLFNRTYFAVFGDPTLDVALDYSGSVVTSCGTHE